ncbi:MAG TPA: HutD family protein [Ferrovibrio sp.]|jgi:environmental stress-induced protein Ves|uniref:HutD/Ves family protein n=1 Tax=Ferrovibrio sp. TaxID=1917215 RepID=UPI002ED4CA64
MKRRPAGDAAAGGGQKGGSRLIRLSDLQPQPWQNGGGVTYEIAADPPLRPGAPVNPKDLLWRVSRAEIRQDGPLSAFPGMTRWIVLLDGAGLTLSFAERGKLTLGETCKLEQFPGGSIAHCALLSGPCTVLNLFAHEELPMRVNLVHSRAPLPSLDHAIVSAHGVSLRLDERHVLNAAVAVV